MQFPRLEIVSSSIRAESRDYKETTTRRRRRKGKGGEGEEDRNGWVGDGGERLFWQDTKRHFICPVLVEGRNLSCSSCHLPSIGAFLNRFPPSSSNYSTYSLQLTRRIVFAALFLHLQRDASPAGNLCDARYSFYVVFFPFSPFSFLFFLLCLPFALIMYRATYSYLVAGAEGAR